MSGLFFEILFLLVVASLILFGVLRKKLAYQPRTNTVVLRIHRAYSIMLAGTLLAVCLFCILLSAASAPSFAEASKVFGVLAIIAFVLYLWSEWYSLSWTLECSETEDFFDYRNFFFRKKRLKYSNFSCYRFRLGMLTLQNDEHRIFVDDSALYYATFVDILKRNHIYFGNE